MIVELPLMSTGSYCREATGDKVNEIICALNAMEAASTSDNSRVMPCPKFIPGANCEIYRTNRCSTIRSCLITVTA